MPTVDGLNIDYLHRYSASQRLSLAKTLWHKFALDLSAITDNENIRVSLGSPLASVATANTASELSTAIENQTIDVWNSAMRDDKKEVVYSGRRLAYNYLNMTPPPIILAGASDNVMLVFNGIAIKI